MSLVYFLPDIVSNVFAVYFLPAPLGSNPITDLDKIGNE